MRMHNTYTYINVTKAHALKKENVKSMQEEKRAREREREWAVVAVSRIVSGCISAMLKTRYKSTTKRASVRVTLSAI